jgi:eukaryotic-like serine/threonine-protein kinase
VVGKQLDARSDIFSLGTVLYEWITGFKLFTGDNEVAILKSISEAKIYAPSYFKADVPEAVEHILMKALEKDREKRYQTAWEMQYDVDQFLSQYEFTPSNIHLSNFLKQLFTDELEDERKRLLTEGAPLPVEEEVDDEDEEGEEEEVTPTGAAAPPSAALRASGNAAVALDPVPAGDTRPVSVKLAAAEYAHLQEVAERHGLSVSALIRELLAGYLKYR